MQELTGIEIPFWIVATSEQGRRTAKAWGRRSYQQVVDHFRGRIQFVQVARNGNCQRPLAFVLDLCGRTELRQLIRLVYHAQGVLCPVGALTDLAAAVAVRPGGGEDRPCISVGAGSWLALWRYAFQGKGLERDSAAPCWPSPKCASLMSSSLGGGGRDRGLASGPQSTPLATPRRTPARTVGEAIRAIEMCFAAGTARGLTQAESAAASEALALGRAGAWDHETLECNSYRLAAEQVIKSLSACPAAYDGTGIVICAGGVPCFTNAWVCINMLRWLGCRLPIELWHLGDTELDDPMRALVRPLGVECIDALEVAKRFPVRHLNGWALKPYSLLHSRFAEVLLLDCDNVAVVNPQHCLRHGSISRPVRRSGRILAGWGRSAPFGASVAFHSGMSRSLRRVRFWLTNSRPGRPSAWQCR